MDRRDACPTLGALVPMLATRIGGFSPALPDWGLQPAEGLIPRGGGSALVVRCVPVDLTTH